MKKRAILRGICLLLVAVMMLFSLACDSEKSDPQPSVESGNKTIYEKTSSNQIKNAKEKLTTGNSPNRVNPYDFGGEEISLMLSDREQLSKEWFKEVPEDNLDEAVLMRHEAVNSTFNVSAQYTLFSSGDYKNAVLTDVLSDLHKYDISCYTDDLTMSVGLRNCTVDLFDEDLLPYLDFLLPCWNQSFVNNASANNRLYYAVGDINLSVYESASVIWLNKTLYGKRKTADDPEDLQTLAINGEWTYEELYKLVNTFFDGDNNEKTSAHTYALAMCDRSVLNSFRYGWDIDFVSENSDMSHSFNLVNNKKAETALEKCRTILNGKGTEVLDSVEPFFDGKAILYADVLLLDRHANEKLLAMEDEYGLMPMPKYNTDQESYATTAQNPFSIIFVLDHSKGTTGIKGDAVSAFLELSAEESYTHVRGYYVNRIIKAKWLATEKSIAIFDIITANLELDFERIYSPQLNNIASLWSDACCGDGTLEDAYMQSHIEFENAIDGIDAWFAARTDE